jgi:transmembrane sensor
MPIPGRIHYLLQQFAEDTISAYELDELRDLLNDQRNDPEAIEYLKQVQEKTGLLPTHSADRLGRLMNKIIALEEDLPTSQQGMQVVSMTQEGVPVLPIPQPDSPVVPTQPGVPVGQVAQHEVPLVRIHERRSWKRYAVAAVAIISLTAGALYLFTNQKRDTSLAIVPVPSKTQIIPGGNKATLTLGNGTTLVLDSTGNGLLANQGNVHVMKLANGQIAYEAGNRGSSEVLMNTMSTPRGGQYQVTLPDATVVWLNASSSITYPTLFTGNERRVSITGEVYFEVAKDKNKPFRVQTNSYSEVQVMGTHFNVNAYPEEDDVKTTLLEGSVKVLLTKGSAGRSVVLQPGQQAVVGAGKDTMLSINKQPDLEQVMAWKDGFFNFDNEDIGTVMRQIARWYDVEVQYEGPRPTDKLIGELPMNASISQVLDALKRIKVNFRIEGRTIIVMN